MTQNTKETKRVLFVCSAGGHLAQVIEMTSLFEEFEYLLVTERIEATRSLEKRFNVRFVHPAGKGRNLEFWNNFFRNIASAIGILATFRPHVIITTGSHTAVPFCYIGKLLRMKVVYILSYARINSRAKAADLVYPIADEFIVQWASAQRLYPKSKYLGGGLY